MDIARSTPQGSQQSHQAAPSGEAEAPRDQQRDGLRTLLRGLSFLQAEKALQPPGAEGPPPAGAKKKLPPTTLERLLTLVPAVLSSVDEGGAKVPEAPGAPAAKAAPPQAADPQAAERQQAAEAEALLSEGEPDEEIFTPDQAPEGDAAPGAMAADVPAPEVFAAEPQAAEAEAAEAEAAPEAPPEVAAPAPAPVQAKGKPAAKAPAKAAAKAPAKVAAKPAAKHAAPAKPAAKAPAKPAAHAPAKAASKAPAAPAKKAALAKGGATPKAANTAKSAKSAKAGTVAPAPDPNLPLDAVHARAAFRWTKKQGFAAVPFIIRRYQRVLGIPANGILSWDFVQAVARFQRAHGLKPVQGKLAGKTAKAVRFILRRDYGLDKKNLLTSLEVKMAQKRNVNAIHDKKNPLNWKVVRELRELLHLPATGGLTPSFLRAVAAFQMQHHLGRSAYISAGTIKSMRSELGGDLNKKILDAALGYEGTSTLAGPDRGQNACAWAVNNILQRAIGHKIGANTNLVASVESALPAYGHRVSSDKAKGGDIVICPTHHIGIATSSSRAISNSSSRAAFVWHSDLTFDNFYGVGTHIWRVTKA
ncbi:MAG: hypothetical protein JNJ59_01635 [Deltaproteobacteria bacterium]|nr:hypothetical protein [Deltaproteobacteria bacterium]